MKTLPRWLVALIVELAIFFNIERLNFGEENIIDIQSFVYVLGLIACVATIALPALRRRSAWLSLALWIGLYVVSKLAIFNDRPLIGGIHTYLSVTEVALLAVTVWLAHHVGRSLADFVDAVENIIFADFKHRVKPLTADDDDIQNELARSRRYHLPLSVVVVEPKPESLQASLHRTVQEVQRAMLGRCLFVIMARSLARSLRRIDLVREQQDSTRFVIVCPETDTLGSAAMAERIRTAAERLGVSVEWGVAGFPDQALTFEELLNQAEAHMRQRPAAPVDELFFPPPAESSGAPVPAEATQK